MTQVDEKYTEYARRVIEGEIVSCKYIRQACERYLSDLSDDRYEFHQDEVEKCIKFISMFKHYEGRTKGKRFILSDWQVFIVCNLIGLYLKGTKQRKYSQALIMIARKNGKSFLIAALSLWFLVADGEGAPQVLNAANSRLQAGILFRMIRALAKQVDPRRKYLHVNRNEITMAKNQGLCRCLSSDSGTADGYGPSLAVIDEMAAGQTDDMYNVLRSGQGQRERPLTIIISTAGASRTNSFYQMVEQGKDILDGTITEDNMFVLLYTLDEGDDYKDPSVWKKACPNLGISVTEKFYKERVQEAQNSPTKFVDVMIKQFNIFQNSVETWISDDDILTCTQPLTYEDFIGEDKLVFGGVDLAAVSDLTALSFICYDSTRDLYLIKSEAFMPQDCLNKTQNNQLYLQANRDNELHLTEGNFTDFDFVLARIKGVMNQGVNLHSIAYDRYMAGNMPIQAQTMGINMIAMPNNIASCTIPTKTLELLILQRRVIFDSNSLIRWNFSNVRIVRDSHDNIMPSKSKSSNKIDIVMSQIMALGNCMASGQLQFRQDA